MNELNYFIRVNSYLIAAFRDYLAARAYVDILCGDAEKGTDVMLYDREGKVLWGFDHNGNEVRENEIG